MPTRGLEILIVGLVDLAEAWTAQLHQRIPRGVEYRESIGALRRRRGPVLAKA